jgi:HEAT repeat protein
MRVRAYVVMLVCIAACGCGKKKSTDQLIEDLQSPEEGERLAAVRLLPQRRGEATKVVPALIGALKDKESDIRWSAAIGLGYFGEEAKEAIPALQTAQHDHDARVREAAGVALTRIDPNLPPPATAKKGTKGPPSGARKK